MKAEKRPEWLKIKVNSKMTSETVTDMLRGLNLNSVCEEANCPNRMECFNNKTATFMILGNNCTRNCTFCNVENRPPAQVDPQEPKNIAAAVKKMGMEHVVITSVTRDDLIDGGASHFVKVIEEIRRDNPNTSIEVLIPDFQGSEKSLQKVIDAKPDIINHNLETVPRLYSDVRPNAIYERSLKLLERVKTSNKDIITKSGIMLGLGEEFSEVVQLLKDLRKVECDILTIGQYLSPSKYHHKVVEYIHPNTFEEYKTIGLDLGFQYIASSPFVRSSYNAYEGFKHVNHS